MQPNTQRPAQAIDVGARLDVGTWNAYQKALTLLAARAAFAPIAALGLAGMALGSPFAGYCGDRFGRRVTLIG